MTILKLIPLSFLFLLTQTSYATNYGTPLPNNLSEFKDKSNLKKVNSPSGNKIKT